MHAGDQNRRDRITGGLNVHLQDRARFAEWMRREYALKEHGDSMTRVVREIFRDHENQAFFGAGNLSEGRTGTALDHRCRAGRSFDRAMESPASFGSMIASLLKALPR